MDRVIELQPMIDRLDNAYTALVAETDRIRRDYGATASTRPAFAAYAAAVDQLDGEFAATYAKLHSDNLCGLRRNRANEARQPEYSAYQVALAAHAAILPLLTDDALTDRLRAAVEDGRGADARALAELSRLRITYPSDELIALSRRADEIGIATSVQQSQRWVTAVEAAYTTYHSKRASYADQVAQLQG
jgi:hypothetical protein